MPFIYRAAWLLYCNPFLGFGTGLWTVLCFLLSACIWFKYMFSSAYRTSISYYDFLPLLDLNLMTLGQAWQVFWRHFLQKGKVFGIQISDLTIHFNSVSICLSIRNLFISYAWHHLLKGGIFIMLGRLTQRESATLTWWKSQVQTLYRPLRKLFANKWMAYAFFIFRAKKPLTLESTLVFSIRKNLSISVFESREKKTLQINDSYPPKKSSTKWFFWT